MSSYPRNNPNDPKGTILDWSVTYGGTKNDNIFSMCITSDGDFVIAGTTYSDGEPDLYVAKVSRSGQLLWEKTVGGVYYEDYGYAITTSDNGIVLTGYTCSYGAGIHDMFLVKMNASGDILWQRTYGGVNYDVAHCLVETPDSGFVICGYSGLVARGWLVRTNSNGDTLWTRAIQWTGCHIDKTMDGGYIIATDHGIIKTDSLGATQWSNNVVIASWVEAYNDGYIAMSTYNLYRISLNGFQVWNRVLSSNGLEQACSLVKMSGDFILITGTVPDSLEAQNDAFLDKYDLDGSRKWRILFRAFRAGQIPAYCSDGSCAVAGYNHSTVGKPFFLLKTKPGFEEGL